MRRYFIYLLVSVLAFGIGAFVALNLKNEGKLTNIPNSENIPPIKAAVPNQANEIKNANVLAQERDILDFAAKNPRSSKVQNPDGTLRTPKYGDYKLEQAVIILKDYPQPFIVPKVISWYLEEKDEKIRASLLRVLAVSRDPRAALVLGNSLKDDSLDVRVAATYGLMDYFLAFGVKGGTEHHMMVTQEWWEKNRVRLENEAKFIESR